MYKQHAALHGCYNHNKNSSEVSSISVSVTSSMALYLGYLGEHLF